jgi:hypothetical protein
LESRAMSGRGGSNNGGRADRVAPQGRRRCIGVE